MDVKFVRYARDVKGEIPITANGTYDVTKYASANVNVQSSPVLLWTNASPASAFAAQTVTLPTGYSGFMVQVCYTGSYTNVTGIGYLLPNTSDGVVSGSTGSQLFDRLITSTTANSITFGVGYNNLSQNNTVAIPLRIWGVKFTL